MTYKKYLVFIYQGDELWALIEADTYEEALAIHKDELAYGVNKVVITEFISC